jgi:hypothetical protein
MSQKQQRHYLAEIQSDGVLVFDDFGRDIAFISKQETIDQWPWDPEWAWESLLQRVAQLYYLV